MKIGMFKYLFLAVVLIGSADTTFAQKKKKSVKKTTKTKTKAKIQSTAPTEDVVATPVAPPPPPPANDSLPLKVIKKSLRPDEAVETSALRAAGSPALLPTRSTANSVPKTTLIASITSRTDEPVPVPTLNTECSLTSWSR
jgi:type IV secretory pathway VirB10-like protein